MSIGVDLAGRLRNTSLPYNQGMSPLFEAVVNSIHSIEEAKLSPDEGKIILEILRDDQLILPSSYKGQGKLGSGNHRDIKGFKIVDNGIGFTEANMESFHTLDSQYKADKGCRGVGRLLWLKAFKKVNVESIYKENDGKFKSRAFTFSAAKGVGDKKNSDLSAKIKRSTSISLDGFEDRYRKESPKTAKAIATSLFEHCLWYFVREGGAPRMLIKDNEEQIDLAVVYDEHMQSSASTETVSIKNETFELTHIKLKAKSPFSHVVAFCAANRLVMEENIAGKIPGLYGKLGSAGSEFVYRCYVGSSFLDDAVRPERTGFNILENSPGALLEKTEISLSDVRDAVVAKASDYLADYLEENKTKSRERVESFVSNKAPRYRPILAKIPEKEILIDPNMSDKDLDIVLHKQLAEIERKLLADGHDVMNPNEGEDVNDYKKRLNEYLETAEDIKKSDLANYVSHRKVILDLFESALKRGDDGKYSREDIIHKLIMPMGKDSNEIKPNSCNLWLLDERLAFHHYLASDKSLSSMPIINSKETSKPDICALNLYDNPLLVSEGEKMPLASIVVVEIKRPMRNDAGEGETKDPIEQALGYLEKIRQGLAETYKGRPIPKLENIPGYCYIVCDITSSIKKRCKVHDLRLTKEGLGYFGYKESYSAYIEVMSFDMLVNVAKERNRAFFDKLGLPV